MKIMRIITRMNVGGPSHQVNVLARAFQNEKDQTHVVIGTLMPGEGDLSGLLDGFPGQITYLPELVQPVSPLNDLRAMVKLIRLMKSFKPDVVHTHHAKAGMVGRAAAWWAGVPVRLHTFHGTIFQGHFHPVKARLFRLLEQWLAGISTKLIAISPALALELTHHHHVGTPEQVVTVPLGFDLSSFQDVVMADVEAINTELGLPADALVILMVGRFTYVKNHVFALEGLDPVFESHPNLHVVLVGEGELEAEVRALANMSKGKDRIHFAGQIQHMPPYYRRAYLTLLTSHSEGTPAVLIESMAAGTPFVASRVGGVPDLTNEGHHGLCYTPDDAPDLQQTLVSLLDNPALRTQLGKAGQRYACSTHSAQTLIRNMHTLYESCYPA